jgi:hypothetical protein
MARDEQHAVYTQRQRCGCVVEVKQIRQLLSSLLFLIHCPRAYVLKRRYGEEGSKERERGEEPPTEREEGGNGKW